MCGRLRLLRSSDETLLDTLVCSCFPFVCFLLCLRVNYREIGIGKDNYSNREEEERKKKLVLDSSLVLFYTKSVASCDLVTKEMIQIYRS